MAVKIFIVGNKMDNSTTLVKAETKGQVNALLRSSFTVAQANVLEVADLVAGGAKIVDATNLSPSEGDAEPEAPATMPGTDIEPE